MGLAGILNTSETTPAAERIAATLFNKLKDLYVWRWVASKAPPAAQTSRCTTDHADLAAPTSLPASAPTEEGPSPVPQHDADKMKGGFTAQARGFGMLGKEVAKKAGKTFIQSSQLAASYLLDKTKKQNDLSAIKDHLPPRLSLDLLKYINQEQMKKWEIDDIFWGKLMKCIQRISP
ncbi:hypothetical protein WJX75_004606 [Coccomyxa subellipsoidea]|uniref:Uncharacterized protein n=1 Tax=Coccomyxa subellipsoidea TaxID=248742 RepID=A0ABR2YHX5_9CHLO